MSYPWTLLQWEHTACPPTIISNTSNFYPYQHTQPTPPFHAKLTKVGSLPQCLVLMCVCVWGGGYRSPLTTGVLRGSSWDLTYCEASVPQPIVGGKRNSCSVHLENTPLLQRSCNLLYRRLRRHSFHLLPHLRNERTASCL